jgi:hypothetical protein
VSELSAESAEVRAAKVCRGLRQGGYLNPAWYPWEAVDRDVEAIIREALRVAEAAGRAQPKSAENRNDNILLARAEAFEERARCYSALERCVELFEAWRDGIFKKLGMAWETPPPAIAGARALLSEWRAARITAQEEVKR